MSKINVIEQTPHLIKRLVDIGLQDRIEVDLF